MNLSSINILQSMSPISLAEADGVKLMNRVDTKYVFGESDFANLMESVSQEYRILSFEDVRFSEYSSLYFDSPCFDCYIKHHNRRTNRHKFRMRRYHSTEACFFEIKHKNNKGRTIKTRMPIPAIEEAFSNEVLAFLQTQAGANLDLVPKLWTSFSRITLVDSGFSERVTIDCNLEFRAGQQRCALPGVMIAEVKQQRDSRYSPIRQQLRAQMIRPLRVSKYCIGTALLNPQIKSNRFKPKLRAIKKIA